MFPMRAFPPPPGEIRRKCVPPGALVPEPGSRPDVAMNAQRRNRPAGLAVLVKLCRTTRTSHDGQIMPSRKRCRGIDPVLEWRALL